MALMHVPGMCGMPPGAQAFGAGMGVVPLNASAPNLVAPEAQARPTMASGEGGSNKTAHTTGSSCFFGVGRSLITRVSNCSKGLNCIV